MTAFFGIDNNKTKEKIRYLLDNAYDIDNIYNKNKAIASD
jgi:hypothetical protein